MPQQAFDIIRAEGYPSGYIDEMNVSSSNLFCWNYRLDGENLCEPSNQEAPSFSLDSLYLDIHQWNPLQKEDTIVEEENEAGEKRVKLYRQKKLISFNALVTDFYLEFLYNFQLYQKWEITRKNGGTFELSSFEVGTPALQTNGYMTVTVTMGIKGGDSVIDSCCGSAFEGAPYEDCSDPDGLPTQPVECSSYALNALVYDSGAGTLTATTTGQPPNTTETFTWYFFPSDNSPAIILSGTASVITVTDPGTYRAIAKAGVCETAPQDFLLQDDCTSFDAIISIDGPYIILEPNRISTIVWEVDTGSGFGAYPDSSLIIEPTQSGTYRATVTSGSCEIQRSVAFTVADCDFGVSISESNDVLTGAITGYSGSDTPVYQWFKDTGAGTTAIVGAVSSTLTISEPGMYYLDVTLDGCTKRGQLLLLGACISFNPFIAYVRDDGLGDVLIMSGHSGAPGPVTIEWWQIRNGEWTSIGVGASITTDEEGPIRMVATSVDGSTTCVKERYTQACIDPNAIEWEEREVATGGQTIFLAASAFTEVGIPDPTGKAEEDVGAEYELYKNGARLVYKHIANVVPSTVSTWSINADGNIELQWPASANDVFVLVRRFIP